LNLALPAVKRLLEEAELPASDLTDAHLRHFFAHGDDGVIGLELYPPVALLRSLAVAPAAQGRGIGTALVQKAERHARSQGVTEIYLLTTTAARFFARAGYELIERGAAPQAIRDTQEFSSLCPASSALMRKRL
jgi:amino-acid N-acetyltransferase